MPQFVRSCAGHIWRLQRARTAREAIATMGSLVAEFGYASDGESFAIADGNEAWLMEMVGKGKEETGFSHRRTASRRGPSAEPVRLSSEQVQSGLP